MLGNNSYIVTSHYLLTFFIILLLVRLFFVGLFFCDSFCFIFATCLPHPHPITNI
nr:MAG TPA: hypothetical protein [Myoviridae sp. ctQ2H14]